MIAHSIAYDGDLDLANDYRESRLIGGGVVDAGAHVIPINGRQLPVHDIGMPLALTPLVWVANQHAGQINRWLPQWFKDASRLNEALLFRHWISLIMALLTGLLAAEMRTVLRRLGATNLAAFCWALLLAVTPPVMSHSFLFFTEIPTALIALFVFRRMRLQPLDSPAVAAVLGVLSGYLVLIHIRNIGIVAGLLAIAILRWRERQVTLRPLALFASGIAAIGVLRTALNLAMWGSLITTPHSARGEPASMAPMLREVFERITGLLFDRDFGLIAYAPIYLLAGCGLIAIWRARPRLARDLTLVIACYLIPVLLPITNAHGWRGGWSPAARYLLPIVPILWIAVYQFTVNLSRAGRAITWLLIAIQIAIDAYVWQEPKTLWKDEDGSIFFPGAQWLPAWTDPGATVSFVTICFAAAVAILVLTRFSRTHKPAGPAGAVV